MMKKFACTVALGAGIMWFADPRSGAERRRRAVRRLRPAMDVATDVVAEAATTSVAGHRPLADTISAKLPSSISSRLPAWMRHDDHRGNPSMDVTPDPTTISELVDLARANGVHGAMDIQESRIVCTTCGAISDVEQVERLWLHRFEGATDPDDMSTVSAMRCPVCSTTGLLITGYGPNASPEESEVIVRLQTPRDSGMAPFLTAAS